jgi:hypothetical protein
MESTTKERLRKKINNKKNKRAGKESGRSEDPEKMDEDSLFNMLNQVNQMLKSNPNMVKKVSKCVNSIFENKDLMNSLVSEIENNVKLDSDSKEPGKSEDQGELDHESQGELDHESQVSQTLDNKSVVVNSEATE